MSFARSWMTTTALLFAGGMVAAPIMAALNLPQSEGFGLDDVASAAVIGAVIVWGNKVLR